MSDKTSSHWQSPWGVVQFGWGADERDKLTDVVTRDPETGSRWTVARVGFPDDPEALEIARLMASAPDLLAALERLASDPNHEDGEPCWCPWRTYGSYHLERCLLARAAVAKARGAAPAPLPAGG